jgi:MFS family permease
MTDNKSFFQLNRVSLTVRLLTAADTVIGTALGMISPIFAIFITQQITGGSVEVAGVATGIYLFVRSLAQVPSAYLIDKIKGERDDFFMLASGWFIFALIPLAYIFINTPLQLYAVQFVYGLSAAIFFPAWYALFTRHIDKGKEALEWGAYQTIVDLSGAFAASIGGFIAGKFGFTALLITASMMSFVSWLFILGVKKDIKSFGQKIAK